MKYLFEAHFTDGTVIAQTPEDQSFIDPLRSAFYDVVQKGIDKVVVFGLKGQDHTYVVDLMDGHFEIDGVPFSAQPWKTPSVPDDGKFELIYFRDHQQHIAVGADKIEAVGHTIQFRFGWEYTSPSGSRYIQTLVII